MQRASLSRENACGIFTSLVVDDIFLKGESKSPCKQEGVQQRRVFCSVILVTAQLKVSERSEEHRQPTHRIDRYTPVYFVYVCIPSSAC
ncbi:unnamed protein product [Hermetia illucens]|uniref:Uncharacterized protein n=1 Tax=Hermetia illucens TaxID=343691 RepID=A0A7R8UPA8_HERIL|nr:unnamed protein product [Hermetia illucens]